MTFPGASEQIQSYRAVIKVVQGAVSLRKTALSHINSLYTNSEFASIAPLPHGAALVDATNRERRPGTKPYKPQLLWFRSRLPHVSALRLTDTVVSNRLHDRHQR
jgi:hypothetical protein